MRCCAFLCGPVRSCVVLCGPVRCLVGLRRCHTWNKFRLIASKWMQEMMQELCAKSLASFLDVSTGHCQYSFAQTFVIFDFKLSIFEISLCWINSSYDHSNHISTINVNSQLNIASMWTHSLILLALCVRVCAQNLKFFRSIFSLFIFFTYLWLLSPYLDKFVHFPDILLFVAFRFISVFCTCYFCLLL